MQKYPNGRYKKLAIIEQPSENIKNYTETVKSVSFDMKAVEGGTFQMGSNENSDEKPIHSVTVHSYNMGKYEVTQKLWKAVMDNNPSHFKGDNRPVEQVSWDDIQKFLKKLNKMTSKNYRLPTETEWEYAASGGSKIQSTIGRILEWREHVARGSTHQQKWAGTNRKSLLGSYAWYSDNSGSKTHNVGTKRPNKLGIYDMSGNVWEWCQDHWHSNYNGAPTNGRAWTSGSSSRRVIRGGSWYYNASGCRVAYRYSYSQGERAYNLGFRLVFVP